VKQDELAQLGKDYVNRDVGIVGISSNDVSNYPDDAPESLKAMAVVRVAVPRLLRREPGDGKATQQPVRQTSSCSMPTNS